MARGTRRDRKKDQFWRRRLAAQARSGLAVRAWCRQHGTQESAFYWWRRELARRDEATPKFLPVRVRRESAAAPRTGVADTGPAAAGRIEIVLADGRRVCLVGPVERRRLADVLAVLAEAAGSDAAQAQAEPAAEAAAC